MTQTHVQTNRGLSRWMCSQKSTRSRERRPWQLTAADCRRVAAPAAPEVVVRKTRNRTSGDAKTHDDWGEKVAQYEDGSFETACSFRAEICVVRFQTARHTMIVLRYTVDSIIFPSRKKYSLCVFVVAELIIRLDNFFCSGVFWSNEKIYLRNSIPSRSGPFLGVCLRYSLPRDFRYCKRVPRWCYGCSSENCCTSIE